VHSLHRRFIQSSERAATLFKLSSWIILCLTRIDCGLRDLRVGIIFDHFSDKLFKMCSWQVSVIYWDIFLPLLQCGGDLCDFWLVCANSILCSRSLCSGGFDGMFILLIRDLFGRICFNVCQLWFGSFSGLLWFKFLYGM